MVSFNKVMILQRTFISINNSNFCTMNGFRNTTRVFLTLAPLIIMSYQVAFEIQGWTRLELLLLRFKPHRVSLTPKKSCTLNIYVTYMQAFAILQLLIEILITEKE